jgi:hypothetical protein
MTIATVSEVFELLSSNPYNSASGLFDIVVDIGFNGF